MRYITTDYLKICTRKVDITSKNRHFVKILEKCFQLEEKERKEILIDWYNISKIMFIFNSVSFRIKCAIF